LDGVRYWPAFAAEITAATPRFFALYSRLHVPSWVFQPCFPYKNGASDTNAERYLQMKTLLAATAITIALAGSAFASKEAGKPFTLQKGNSITNNHISGSGSKAQPVYPDKRN
jgi:hypothetical protein